jgi:hypothetical protein
LTKKNLFSTIIQFSYKKIKKPKERVITPNLRLILVTNNDNYKYGFLGLTSNSSSI